jgi:ParB family chromosome partitioning protein
MEQNLLPVSKCYESETNPRGTKFGGASFNELVASIKEKGVLQPVLARPRKHGGKDFEIVAGNRRYRASTVAGLIEIPAIVKDTSDDEAREAQIIENLQRSDISNSKSTPSQIFSLRSAFRFRGVVWSLSELS